MITMKTKRCGRAYEKRVADVNRIYDQWAKSGLSNREIWRRYVYPIFAISERTFYKLLKASSVKPSSEQMEEMGFLFNDFFNQEDEQRRQDFFSRGSQRY